MLAPRSVCEVPVGNMKKNIKKKNINEIENEFYESDKIWRMSEGWGVRLRCGGGFAPPPHVALFLKLKLQ